MEPFERYSVHHSKTDQPPPNQELQSQIPMPGESHQHKKKKGKKDKKSSKHHQPEHQQQQQQQLQHPHHHHHQQQHQPYRYASPQDLILHLQSRPSSPPSRPNHQRHYDQVQQRSSCSSEREQQSLHQQFQQYCSQGKGGDEEQQKLEEAHKEHHCSIQSNTNSRNKPLILSPRNPSTDAPNTCVMATGSSCLTSSSKLKDKGRNPFKTKDKHKKGTKSATGQIHNTQNTKLSKNSVAALEAGIPERFCDSPEGNYKGIISQPQTTTTTTATSTTAFISTKTKTSTSKEKKEDGKKLPNHDLTDIPQTNLSVALIVFCCFNPVFGMFAIYLSLTAAKEYRDGYVSKGNSRARWSIVVSLFGITATMIIVSALVVVFTMSNNTNSSYKRVTSDLGF